MLSFEISQVQIGPITILYWNTFLVTLLCLGSSTIVAIILTRLGYEYCALRRIPAMDVIDESVRICAEKGRPFLFTTGNTGYSGAGSGIQMVEADVSMARYLTKRCAELGVRWIGTTQDPQLYLLFYDFARHGYLEAGHPELFNERDIRHIVVGGSFNATYENVDTIRNEKPAAFVGLGHFGAGTHVPYFQEAVTQGAFVIGSSYWPDETAQAAMSSDYTLMGAEQTVCGAYVDNDPDKMSVFVGEDLAKIVLIAISIIMGILWIGGIRLFV
ncbi:MAG: hypothetical protein QG670_2634 [Thermoproteota archaeon]|nr:hypothetical protein [Thermoproteota archaeon]